MGGLDGGGVPIESKLVLSEDTSLLNWPKHSASIIRGIFNAVTD